MESLFSWRHWRRVTTPRWVRVAQTYNFCNSQPEFHWRKQLKGKNDTLTVKQMRIWFKIAWNSERILPVSVTLVIFYSRFKFQVWKSCRFLCPLPWWIRGLSSCSFSMLLQVRIALKSLMRCQRTMPICSWVNTELATLPPTRTGLNGMGGCSNWSPRWKRLTLWGLWRLLRFKVHLFIGLPNICFLQISGFAFRWTTCSSSWCSPLTWLLSGRPFSSPWRMCSLSAGNKHPVNLSSPVLWRSLRCVNYHTLTISNLLKCACVVYWRPTFTSVFHCSIFII